MQLRIAGNTALTAVGETSQLTTIASFADGTEKDVTAETMWTSSDQNVATISAGLLVSARNVACPRMPARCVSAANSTFVNSADGAFIP